jgi:hypothetical protein
MQASDGEYRRQVAQRAAKHEAATHALLPGHQARLERITKSKQGSDTICVYLS